MPIFVVQISTKLKGMGVYLGKYGASTTSTPFVKLQQLFQGMVRIGVHLNGTHVLGFLAKPRPMP